MDTKVLDEVPLGMFAELKSKFTKPCAKPEYTDEAKRKQNEHFRLVFMF